MGSLTGYHASIVTAFDNSLFRVLSALLSDEFHSVLDDQMRVSFIKRWFMRSSTELLQSLRQFSTGFLRPREDCKCICI